ncbi:MAG: glycosyltransferase [Clostridia bacterium]
MKKGLDAIVKLFTAAAKKKPAEAFAPEENYYDYLIHNSPSADILNTQVNKKLPVTPCFRLMIIGNAKSADKERTLRSISAQTYTGYTLDKDEYDYILYIFDGDELTADALFEFACAAQTEPDIIYCDEDYIENGVRSVPIFKPEIREFTLLSYNMVGRGIMVKRSIHERCAMAGSDDTAQYAYVLGAVHLATDYVHIKKPIYSRCTHENITDEAIAAIDTHLDSQGTGGYAVPGMYPGSFRISHVTGDVKVGIVILNCDALDSLRRLLESVEQNTVYKNYTFIIVDYGSRDARTNRYYEILETNKLARIVRCRGYNYPILANHGAKRADGDVLVFLGRDTEVISEYWLNALLETLNRGAAAAGGKLVDSHGNILFAGGTIGIRGWADSVYRSYPDDTAELRRNHFINSIRNVSYISEDCFAIGTDEFFDVGCFDESFERYGADIALCNRLAQKNHQCVYTPYAVLRHHGEPASAKTATDADLVRCYDVIRQTLLDGDIHYNPNYDYSSLQARVAVTPYPAIKLNPMYK